MNHGQQPSQYWLWKPDISVSTPPWRQTKGNMGNFLWLIIPYYLSLFCLFFQQRNIRSCHHRIPLHTHAAHTFRAGASVSVSVCVLLLSTSADHSWWCSEHGVSLHMTSLSSSSLHPHCVFSSIPRDNSFPCLSSPLIIVIVPGFIFDHFFFLPESKI